MQTYEILVQNRAVKANSTDMTLVRTSVGIDQVHVLFDNQEWLGFPITITFAQGDELVSQTLVVSEVVGSDEWVAEATVTVPYEVIDMTGPIRVTLQGTDADGRHIITAKGSPLSVEEAGDVVMGDIPSDAPTVDQWHQAYAQAMEKVSEAASVISNLQSEVTTLLSDLESRADAYADNAASEILTTYTQPATTTTLGLVKIGSGLNVLDGTISVESTNGITKAQISQLTNLARLASYCFDTTFDAYGMLEDSARVKVSALPLESIVDGETLVVNEGKLSLVFGLAEEGEY